MPHGSKKPQDRQATYEVVHVWVCDNCGSGGMTTFIEICPECQHPRCSNCTTEPVTKRTSDGRSGPIDIAASNVALWDDPVPVGMRVKSASITNSILCVFIVARSYRGA